MVPIFTYRDERKLFAVIGAVIVSALVALIQLDAAKTGKPSIIAIGVTSVAVFAQQATAAIADGTRGLAETLGDAPHLYAENGALRAQNRALTADNVKLREAAAKAPDAQAIAGADDATTDILATTVGYDPENATRSIEIDRGSDAGIRRDMGVLNEDGVVGRVVAVNHATSTVLLVTDGASKVPAIVQRGRWWGIATGTDGRLRLRFVSQDAKLRLGDAIVTGEGRSFHAGLLIGTISAIEHPDGSLYQTAVVEPAVAFGRLSRVVVRPAAHADDNRDDSGS